ARPHLLHHRDEHRHPEVLERAGVGVPALLDPQVLEPDLAPVAPGPEQVRVTLVHRHDVLVVDVGANPFLLAPDARAVRPLVAVRALLEAPLPGGGRGLAQLVHVVDDLEQPAVARGVDHLVEAVALRGIVQGFEPGAVMRLVGAHSSSSIRISRVGAVTSSSPSIASSARRTAASRAGWVSTTTGTAPRVPSGSPGPACPRPFWITDWIEMPCSPSAPAMCASTPGRSTAVKRR